jgi:glutaryl-CoA dehydrogenase
MVRDSASAMRRRNCNRASSKRFATRNRIRRFFVKWELGLLGSTLPAECGGLNYVCYGIAREVDASIRLSSMMSVQSSLVMFPIYTYGSEAQRKKYLPRLASGESIGCFADRTEPRPDPGSMATRTQRPGGYGCPAARRGSPMRRSPTCCGVGQDRRRRHSRLHPRERNGGLTAPKIEGKFTCARRYRRSGDGRGVRARGEPLAQRRGPQRPFGCLNAARYGIAWGAMGAAELRLARGAHATLDRTQFGRPRRISSSRRSSTCKPRSPCAAGCLRLGRLKDEGIAAPEITSIMKRNSCGKSLDIARMARDMHGGNGIVDEFHVIRHLLNLETVNTYEGTHDVHALILGRAQTGISAF